MGLDNLVLDLVGSFLFVFLFKGASILVELLRLSLDLDDSLLSLAPHLLNVTWFDKGQQGG